MNSLNSDPNPSLNQNKFKYELQSPYYQYYRIPSNSNISPDFTSLQNPYATNPLLATQFSFQYSDNQGLGDGMNTNNHSNVWNAAPINATLSTQSRNNQPATIDPNSTHFFSIPSHGPPQAAEQNLFYQYGYGATNNMFWTHPSMLEYKSTNQNYSLPPTDKPQSWSETVINGQYPPSLSNSLSYKTNLSSIEQNNQILPINNNHVNYQKHFTQNGYQISQMDSNESDISTRVSNDNPHIGNVERNTLGKSDNPLSQDKKFPVTNNANNMNSQMDSLQTQLANDCSIHKDNSNFDANRASSHNNNQQSSYSPKSLSKHHTSPNVDRGENSGYWNPDSNQTSTSTCTKSYAKVAKLPSRNSNCCNNISNSTSLTSSYYMNNGIPGNPGNNSRPNYKSTMNGFATGYSRSNTNNNSSNNWFNSSAASNGNAWNPTKTKWSQDNSRNSVNNLAVDPNVKTSWAAKASLSSAEENMRNAEFKMKEIQAQINPKRFEINFEKTRYFVIKSYSEDDVHRSIKYKIWCSTKEGNKRLNEAFQNAQKNGGHVLLFFSVNGSGHFCGIAEMTSCVQDDVITGVWCQEKWKGKFSVKWIYVKDVPNTQLRHISTKVKPQKPNSECSTEIKPITNLRDATELKSERTLGPGSSYKDDPGYQALRIIMDCKSNMSIFDDFLHYEKREMGIES